MHIVILQGAFLPVPPVMGGAVEKLWSALGAAFARQGHAVTHISRSHEGFPDVEDRDDVTHRRVRGYSSCAGNLRYKWRDLLYTWRAISAMPQADIVVTNTFWAPILLRWRRRGRVLVSVERMPKGQMRFYRWCSRLRAPSSAVAKAIHAECPSARITTIPNPLPIVFPAAPLTGREPTLLYVGRIHPEKGLHLLLAAFAKLSPHHLTWRLRIVGPHEFALGGGGPAYLESLRTLAGSAPVEWVGMIKDPTILNDLYGRSPIFVYPSIAERGETFGLAVLEAMAAGCAPVVSNLDCFQDFIRHDDNGLVFDFRGADPVTALADRLAELMADPERTTTLATAATAVRVSHGIERIAGEFLDEFARMHIES